MDLEQALNKKLQLVDAHVRLKNGSDVVTSKGCDHIYVRNVDVDFDLQGSYFQVITSSPEEQDFWREFLARASACEVVYLADGIGWSEVIIWCQDKQSLQDFRRDKPGKVSQCVIVASNPKEDQLCRKWVASPPERGYYFVGDWGQLDWIDSSGVRRSGFDGAGTLQACVELIRQGFLVENVQQADGHSRYRALVVPLAKAKECFPELSGEPIELKMEFRNGAFEFSSFPFR